MAVAGEQKVNGIRAPSEVRGETSHVGTASMSGAASAGSGADDEDKPMPKEMIGWLFVEQYYNTMSKEPEKLHLFYTKKSQFIAGDEAETVNVAVGQRQIGERIKELDIQDCKVRVTNVDSQESAKCILVQVIGEMSNKAAPQRKFVQTFVLAEQPTGYYVLNDVFRYILEEDVEGAEQDGTTQASVPPPETVKPTLSSSEDPQEQEESAQSLDQKLEKDVLEQPEGERLPTVVAAPDPVETVSNEGTPDPEVASSAAVEAFTEPEQPVDPVPSPVPSSPQPTKQVSVPESAPTKPTGPRTWAERLGGTKTPAVVGNSVKAAASAVAEPLKKITPAYSTKKTTTKPEESQSTNGVNPTAPESSTNGWQMAGSESKQRASRPHSQSVSGSATPGTILAYVKNVNDKVDASILKTKLEGFGKLEYFDVSRPKNCAFVEFADAAAYRAAVDSNPHSIGGEQIYVEERRPKANAYGANYNARGGARGGRGDRNAGPGRGNFSKDGQQSSRGNHVPRGRGGGFARGRGGSVPAS